VALRRASFGSCFVLSILFRTFLHAEGEQPEMTFGGF
jgi:hypothetical protein